MKICPKCNINKNLNEFNKHKTREHQTYCRKCQKIVDKICYQRTKDKHIERKTIRKNKLKEHVLNIKKNSICKCGESDYKCLLFHHLGKDRKVANVSDLVRHGVSLDKINAEIKKCEVICFNCHAKEHNGFMW